LVEFLTSLFKLSFSRKTAIFAPLWQSLNTGPRFYLRLIRRTGWLWIYTSRTTDGRTFKPKKLSVPLLYPGVPAGLTPFRGLVSLGRRNLVPTRPSDET
jgi:hypothetical protein